MTHLWVRAEQRDNEDRVGLTPEGAAQLIAKGIRVTVEKSKTRIIPIDGYRAAGCEIAEENSWPNAPKDAIIFGLKELPDDSTPLIHRHIMFGHAYKGQYAGQILLKRFKEGGGTLYDLEYLVDDSGRRVAAFGYWAGFAGAALALKSWAAQKSGSICAPVSSFPNKDALIADILSDFAPLGSERPSAIVIGALGRVGTGAADMLAELDCPLKKWDQEETAKGGPFPEILQEDIFMNCILARPTTPVFVPKTALAENRKLTVVGDVACDPDSDYNPVPIYSEATSWQTPALRVRDEPPLDVMAIDNLPSLLPLESSEDYANQLLSTLLQVDDLSAPVWTRAEADFKTHSANV